MPHKTIGIVSGVGPLAGADVLNKLFKNAAVLYHAKEDDEYPETILINHGISGVDNTAQLSDTFKSEIIDTVQRVEAAGATIIGIACNTAHVYFPEILTNQETTLLNIVDVVSKAAAIVKDSKCLLLTSFSSREAKLYNDTLARYNVNYELVSDSAQIVLDQIIDDIIAHHLQQAGDRMSALLQQAKDDGYEVVIAACTELPIAISYAQDAQGLQIIDSNEELARALLSEYYSGN